MIALLMVAGLPLRSHAQRSPLYTGTTPFVEVGAGTHDGHFLSDADHFMYCPEGSDVTGIEVTIVSEFYTNSCNSRCTHPPRTVTWSVSGGNPTVLEKVDTLNQDTGQTSAHVKYLLKVSAGDTITATCTIGAASTATQCQERKQGGYYDHTGNHGGATATCTIKFWRLDLDVSAESDDPEEDPVPVDPTSPMGSIYQTIFAKSITTTAQLVGASPAATSPWHWESMIDPPQVHTSKSSGTSWAGEMVAETGIFVTSRVQNGCDPTTTSNTLGSVFIKPSIRRPGWKMENVSASVGNDMTWHSDDPRFFPGIVTNVPLGLNTNAVTKYRKLFAQIVTPIYVDLSITDPGAFPPENWPGGVPNDSGDFTGKVTQISGGPNGALFYNSSTNIFEVNRIALLNHWITPQGTWPSIVPNVNPTNGIPANYTNWLDLYTAGQQSCQCSDPSSHGATNISNIRHATNYLHESSGSSGSANQDKLGHQIILKKAIEGTQPEKYDILWRCDLLYAESEAALRVGDEIERSDTSAELSTAADSLHTFRSPDPQKHNFYGFFWLYNSTSGWTQPMQNY